MAERARVVHLQAIHQLEGSARAEWTIRVSGSEEPARPLQRPRWVIVGPAFETLHLRSHMYGWPPPGLDRPSKEI
jgi:hypothetical protein